MIDPALFLNALLHVLPVLYGVAFFNYVLLFLTEERLVLRLARPLLTVSVLTNVAYVLAYTIHHHHIPLVNVFQVMGAVGLATAATYLVVESRTKTPFTGPFILLPVVVCQVVHTFFLPGSGKVPEILFDPLFGVHVTAAVLGYSAFVVAAAYGFLYLALYHDIRRKKFGLIFRRLPSLDILDRMNAAAATVGLVCLTVAIAAGLIWSRERFGSVQMDPKVIAAMATWLIYGVAVLGRPFSVTGARTAYTTLAGFVVMLFSLFGVNFFFTHFHRFGG